jgi:hypothetical protein
VLMFHYDRNGKPANYATYVKDLYGKNVGTTDAWEGDPSDASVVALALWICLPWFAALWSENLAVLLVYALLYTRWIRRSRPVFTLALLYGAVIVAAIVGWRVRPWMLDAWTWLWDQIVWLNTVLRS